MKEHAWKTSLMVFIASVLTSIKENFAKVNKINLFTDIEINIKLFNTEVNTGLFFFL